MNSTRRIIPVAFPRPGITRDLRVRDRAARSLGEDLDPGAGCPCRARLAAARTRIVLVTVPAACVITIRREPVRGMTIHWRGPSVIAYGQVLAEEELQCQYKQWWEM